MNENSIFEKAVSFYTNKELKNGVPSETSISEANAILESLCKISTSEILMRLEMISEDWEFSCSDIPQFSSLEDCYLSVDRLIRSGLDGITYARMGFLLRTGNRKKGADCKYGENHSKCAGLMGLCRIDKGIWRNSYSYAYESLPDKLKSSLQPKLCLGIKLIRGYFKNEESEEFLKEALHCLSASTHRRRISNIRTIIQFVKKDLL